MLLSINDWERNNSINSTTLATDLLKQRSKRNKAHKIELSSDSKYNCFICEVQIKVEKQKNYAQYSFYKHYIAEEGHFSASSFVIGNAPQTGITLPKGIEYLYVYFHPGKNGSPLIIYIPPEDDERSTKGTWWKKSYRKGAIWEKEGKDMSPPNPSEDPTIVEIISEIPENAPAINQQTSSGTKTAASVLTPLAATGVTETANFFLNPSWSIIRRVSTIFSTAV
ncbi:hypothetical protein BEWA_047420 [Theileria equi strain WA]|uniref:Uncharacterized protein n=1 Tax=Theileria equi strain WA TaxID=1537102 RepID=L1LA24_THEEQ|nr:hypothetical protein BEWA_047420 [Theileria equi strain WA]EKX72277.1 hypothetical protein BEWA_047420 [Theileria equi strain WA]|eukprot:XP_004831729.1 hypothetical protein BEWA_047420 [Theileria equi strain WA]